MNPQTQENLTEYPLQKLVNQSDSESMEVAALPILPTSKLARNGIVYYIEKPMHWFFNLPITAKLAVVVVAIVIGFAILQAALKLIASAISMALLVGLLYLGYNFFVAGNSSQIKE